MDGSGQRIGIDAEAEELNSGLVVRAPREGDGNRRPGTSWQTEAYARARLFLICPDVDPSWAGSFSDWAETSDYGDRTALIIGSPPTGLSGGVLRRCQWVDAKFPDRYLPWLANLIAGDPADVTPPERSDSTRDLDVRFAVRTLADIRWCSAAISWLADLSTGASLGFGELLMNAVEHGNLEISFDEKTKLLSDGTWHEELLRRLEMPVFRDRLVNVTVHGRGHISEIGIQDEGPGFDWQTYIDAEPPSHSCHHGRGIAMAGGCGFASFNYLGCGNEVALQVARAS